MSTLFTKLRSADVSTCVVPPTLSSYPATELLQPRDLACGTLFQSGCVNDIIREVAVRELGGTLFRQIFWSRNGALANIAGHRLNANTESFQQITSY